MKAYLFDIDGVLTNPQSPDVIHKKMFDILIAILKRNIPMGFISGRGMSWLRPELIKKMETYVAEHNLDKTILDLLYISGEFGVVTALHTNGERKESMDKKFIIPSEIRQKLAEHAEKFGKLLAIEDKEAVFSLRGDTYDEKKYREVRKETVASFKKVLEKYPEIEVLSDRIAINIRYKKANKTYATDKFISWLQKKELFPEKFFVFGDSPADLEMGFELEKQQFPLQFVYVGEAYELDGNNYSFPLTVTKGHCDKGTEEYLIADH